MHSVTWRDSIILFDFVTPTIFYHHAGEWTSKITSGEGPVANDMNIDNAQVIDEKMFAIDDHNIMHVLDLHSWRWSTITPGGTLPSGWYLVMASWVYKGKIYYLN